ncbi:hypothetical protein Lal_00042987 [Lupinus albus]|nr:hypothetical protein Lal_00042987 [Lupinus albus]
MDERIGRKWMIVNRLTKEYEDGVKSFVKFAYQNAEHSDRILCPCLKCCYSKRVTAIELKYRLELHMLEKTW